MTRRILASRHFVAALLAMVTGMVLFYTRPFPEEHLFLKLIAKRRPLAFQSFRWLPRVSFHHSLHDVHRNTVGPLCRNAEVPSSRRRATTSEVSRPAKARRSVSCPRRGARPAPAGPLGNTRLARDSRTGTVHWYRDSGGRG